jgi:hypothetical protein
VRNILKDEPIRHTLLGPAVLVCIWFIMAFLIQPVGNFPLNDDWCFGRVVHSLVVDGSLRFPKAGAPSLIAQALWGVIFCIPFGFSFTALRMSTLVLGLVGVLATYYMLREIKAARAFAVTGSLLIAINPLYYVLSNSFMTDVPFYAFAMLSVLFFIRGIKRESTSNLVGATALACVATLTRQIGILIPICFVIAFTLKNGLNKKTLFKALLPALIVLVVHISYTKLVELLAIGSSHAFRHKTDMLLNRLVHPNFESFGSFVNMSIYTALYLGLFLLPLLLIKISVGWPVLTRRKKVTMVSISSVVFVLTILFLVLKGRIMPVAGNVLYDIGLGPPLLHDTYILKLPHLPRAPVLVWLAVTFAAITGASLLTENVISVIPSLLSRRKLCSNCTNDKWLIAFFLSFCVFYSGLIGLTRLFDRYLLFFLPMLMGIISCSINYAEFRINRRTFCAVFCIMAVFVLFTVAGTHDYLAWNKARWKALDYLVGPEHIHPRRIDGGYEFNGWHQNPDSPAKPIREWWVYEDDYIISFGPVTGYEEVKSYSYSRWLPVGRGNILILRRAS